MSIKNLKDKAFAHPEVKAEYDLLESEFALIDTLLSIWIYQDITSINF